MIELEHHYFATPNELMDLGNNHEWLLTSQKRKITKHNVPLDRSIQNHLWSILASKNKPESDQASRSNYQFKENAERNTPNNITETQLGKQQQQNRLQILQDR